MIISRTPLRISLAGGGSDFEEYYKTSCGAVVSTAIDKYIYITVNKKFDDMIRVSYSKTEMVSNIEEVEHNIIREALKLVGITKGIEVVYMGDIPLGSAGIGLGSSSALAVGVLNALYAFQGRYVSAERLSQEACKLEIDILKQPIGKQDQYISSYGGFNYIQFNPDGSVFTDPVIYKRETKDKLNDRLMLFYTGIQRLSSDILYEQEKNTHANLEVIGKMVGLAKRLRDNLTNNKIDDMGEILHEGWLLKKRLAEGISNQHIDNLYDKARKAGAIGGKILGAGAGGFLLLYCPEENQGKVSEALSDLRESPFKLEPQGSKIIYVQD